jgi:hypothetical protein
MTCAAGGLDVAGLLPAGNNYTNQYKHQTRTKLIYEYPIPGKLR